jgi:hypothetical protein
MAICPSCLGGPHIRGRFRSQTMLENPYFVVGGIVLAVYVLLALTMPANR